MQKKETSEELRKKKGEDTDNENCRQQQKLPRRLHTRYSLITYNVACKNISELPDSARESKQFFLYLALRF